MMIVYIFISYITISVRLSHAASPNKPATPGPAWRPGVRINTPEEGDVYAPTMGELKVGPWDHRQHAGAWHIRAGGRGILKFCQHVTLW